MINSVDETLLCKNQTHHAMKSGCVRHPDLVVEWDENGRDFCDIGRGMY
jgi:hypothetical protein